MNSDTKNGNVKTVLLTGATGTMGMATLREFTRYPGQFRVIAFARDSKKNHKKLAPFLRRGDIEVFWGDLNNANDITKAVADANIVLHVGGMVSPAADLYPEKTWKVNVGSMRLIADAVKARNDSDRVTVVYIGSVAQYGFRPEPRHWGRTGDPMAAAVNDGYAISKIAAERVLTESGLKRWVSLRQTGILCPELLFKGSDPISFHVPLRGVLEWATAEQSGRLLVNLCRSNLPDTFYRRFYNIGGGKTYRLGNYEFERLLMNAISCPPPEKVFETDWFALRNFHGVWYEDSDKLEEILNFRGDTDAETYFRQMASRLPFYFRLAGIVPAALIKAVMRRVAMKRPLGTLSWRHGGNREMTDIFFGSEEAREAIPDWKEFDLSPQSNTPIRLSHGYDESKPESELDIEDMKEAALFRGGDCLSKSMTKGDLYTPLEWQCARGHKFSATPATILLGGHWCPDCFPKHHLADASVKPVWDYTSESRINPFLAQIMADRTGTVRIAVSLTSRSLYGGLRITCIRRRLYRVPRTVFYLCIYLAHVLPDYAEGHKQHTRAEPNGKHQRCPAFYRVATEISHHDIDKYSQGREEE